MKLSARNVMKGTVKSREGKEVYAVVKATNVIIGTE